MNSKIMSRFLISFLFFVMLIPNVKAEDWTNIGGGGISSVYGCNRTLGAYCMTLSADPFLNGDWIDAIRVSAVDENGDRISSTKSVDYFNDATEITAIQKFSTYKFSDTKLTKNEVLKNTSYDITSETSVKNSITAKYLNGLDNFVGIGSNQIIRNFFVGNEVNTSKVMADINYKPSNYTDDEKQTHYLLIEPVVFVSFRFVYTVLPNIKVAYHMDPDYFEVAHFYGSGTEVAIMYANFLAVLNQKYDANTSMTRSLFWKQTIPFSVYTTETEHPVTGDLMTTVAGLDAVSYVTNSSAVPALIATKKGYAAGHIGIWILDDDDDDDDDEDIPEPTDCGISKTCTPTGSYIYDSNDWSCLFNKKNVDSRVKKVENKYCQIACQEKVSFVYPQEIIDVEAGQFFSVGSTWSGTQWGPIKVSGIRTCKTSGPLASNDDDIDYKQFAIDYKAANDKVLSTWNTYQIARNKQYSVDNASSSTGCGWSCDATDPLTGACIAGSYKGTTMIGASSSYKGVTYKENYCTTSPKPNYSASSKYNTYLAAIRSRTSILDDIEDCNNLNDLYDELDPSISLEYSEPKYGNIFELEYDETLLDTSYYFKGTSTTPSIDSYTSTSSIKTYNCGYSSDSIHSSCADTVYIDYPTNDSFTEVSINDFSFKLPDETYQWILKPSDFSVSNLPSNHINYIDLGFSNLPVHPTTPEGFYDLNLLVGTLGASHDFNNELSGCDTYNGQCNVSTGIIEGIGDLYPVFRPISLEDPFPGEDGTGRDAGENWKDYDIARFIENNRNVDGEELYGLEPMYEINLTPSDILEIREYNAEQDLGYADFNLTCELGTGLECKSDFIRRRFAYLFEPTTCGMSEDYNLCN